MKIKIDLNRIFESVRDHAGMIGKRVRDTAGGPLYLALALSSREKPVIDGYALEAAHTIFGTVPERVSDYHKADGHILFSISGGDDNDDLTEKFTDAIETYVRTYCLARYLDMAAPDYARKYKEDIAVQITALTQMIYHKSSDLTSSRPMMETKGKIFTNTEKDENDRTDNSEKHCSGCC